MTLPKRAGTQSLSSKSGRSTLWFPPPRARLHSLMSTLHKFSYISPSSTQRGKHCNSIIFEDCFDMELSPCTKAFKWLITKECSLVRPIGNPPGVLVRWYTSPTGWKYANTVCKIHCRMKTLSKDIVFTGYTGSVGTGRHAETEAMSFHVTGIAKVRNLERSKIYGAQYLAIAYTCCAEQGGALSVNIYLV